MLALTSVVIVGGGVALTSVVIVGGGVVRGRSRIVVRLRSHEMRDSLGRGESLPSITTVIRG